MMSMSLPLKPAILTLSMVLASSLAPISALAADGKPSSSESQAAESATDRKFRDIYTREWAW